MKNLTCVALTVAVMGGVNPSFGQEDLPPSVPGTNYNAALTPSTNLTFDLQFLQAPVFELGSPIILGLRYNASL
jgi:hypothetical protein